MQEPKRISLATLPTPLIRLERLGRKLGNQRNRKQMIVERVRDPAGEQPAGVRLPDPVGSPDLVGAPDLVGDPDLIGDSVVGIVAVAPAGHGDRRRRAVAAKRGGGISANGRSCLTI